MLPPCIPRATGWKASPILTGEIVSIEGISGIAGNATCDRPLVVTRLALMGAEIAEDFFSREPYTRPLAQPDSPSVALP